MHMLGKNHRMNTFSKPAKRKPEPVDSTTVVCPPTPTGRREYLRRIIEMVDRQQNVCAICELPLIYLEATFDHEAGRGMGGGHRNDLIEHEDGSWMNAALHARCNALKSSVRYKWTGGKYLPVKSRNK